MTRQNINTSDTPNTGRTKINDNFTELYDQVVADAVPETRQINTTSPLTGGGSLAADRTIGHATSGVSADTYESPASVTVDDTGHITEITPGTGGGGGGGIGPHALSEHTDFGIDAPVEAGDAVVRGTGYITATESEGFEDTAYAWEEDAGNDAWARNSSVFYTGSWSLASPDDASGFPYFQFNFTLPDGARNGSVSIRWRVQATDFSVVWFSAQVNSEDIVEWGNPPSPASWREATVTFDPVAGELGNSIGFLFANDGAGTGRAYIDEIVLTYEMPDDAWVPGKVADYEAPLRVVSEDPDGALDNEQWLFDSGGIPEIRTRLGDSKYRASLGLYSLISEFSIANDSSPQAVGNSVFYRGRQFTPQTDGMLLTGALLRSVSYGDSSSTGEGRLLLTTSSGTVVQASKRFFHDAPGATYGAKYVYFDSPVELTSGVTYELGYGSTGNFDRVAYADSGAGTSDADITVGDSVTATNEAGSAGRAVVTTSWPNMAIVLEKPQEGGGGTATDAYSVLTASLTQPAVNGTVEAEVDQSGWLGLDQYVYLEAGGFYRVNAIADATHVTLLNLGYPDNAAAGATIASGKKLSPSGPPGSPANPYNVATLGADVSNSTTTLANVTGLSFAVVSGETYRFRFLIIYDAALSSTGARFTLNGPTFTALGYRVFTPAGTSSMNSAWLNTYDSGTTASSSAYTTGNVVTIEGIVKPSASGTLTARFASELASQITVKAGSQAEWLSSAAITAGTATALPPTRATTAPSSPLLGQLWEDTTTTPATLKMWNGSVWEVSLEQGQYPSPVTITTNTTANAEKRLYLANCTSGGVVLTLPTAVGRAGKEYVIKKVDASANALTIDAAGSETIDGNATIDTATPYDSVVLESDGTNWRITTSPTGVTGIESRTSEPGSPVDQQQWIRSDLSPPELRYRNGSTTYKLTFTAV